MSNAIWPGDGGQQLTSGVTAWTGTANKQHTIQLLERIPEVLHPDRQATVRNYIAWLQRVQP